jgi:hypothetical protein
MQKSTAQWQAELPHSRHFELMSDRSKQGLQPILSGLGSRLAALEQRAQKTIELAEKVRAALPPPEKLHVVSASYRADTLVILMDSAAWCPQVRYAEAELREKLVAAGETQFTQLRVRVGRSARPQSGAKDGK